MATTFAAVNTAAFHAPDHTPNIETPTTPRQDASLIIQPPRGQSPADVESPDTPTRHSFAGVPGQRPLPSEPLTSTHTAEQTEQRDDHVDRGYSTRSAMSQPSADSDVEMGDGDGDVDGAEDDGSDNESITSESQQPSKKKKKGQRFFCTDFPPCQLSFTRSEHLARHIRHVLKHTGERPFQCHCSRRFSRLDNLRQHAQTVHVNEEIPGDSLAATSTRFQRQIRTDRVRPPGNRPRTSSTLTGPGPHSRGHSRNVSTSSIGSTISNMVIPDDARRRPPPLAMANDGSHRGPTSMDYYNGVMDEPGPAYGHYNQSPSGYSTPTSQNFPNDIGSPGYTSAFASPSSTLSRSSFYNGSRHSRRLSVPVAACPIHAPGSATYPPAYYSPGSSQASNFSQNTSVYGSPTSSVFSHGRRDSESESEYRRRTWHPGTHSIYSQRPATSGLSYHQTPDEPRPALSQQPAASQVTRLPGIESFDHAPPITHRQHPSPMMLDSMPPPPTSALPPLPTSALPQPPTSALPPPPSSALPPLPSSGRPLDAGLHQGLNRLDITSGNTSAVDPHRQPSHQGFPPASQHSYFNVPPQSIEPQHINHQRLRASMPEGPVTSTRNKRQAWYGGPVGPAPSTHQMFMAHRPSPEDSGSSDGAPTPLNSQSSEYNPLIVNPSDPGVPHSTIMEEQQHKAYNPPAPPYPSGSHQHQLSMAQGYQLKPTLPIRNDSGFQNLAAVGTTPSQEQKMYASEAGDDARLANRYVPARSEQNRNDMGRLEALVAVATSENRAVEHQR